MLIEAPFNETTERSSPPRLKCIGRWVQDCSNPRTGVLQMELAMRRLRYVTQHTLPIVYKGGRRTTIESTDREDALLRKSKSRR